MRSTGGSRQHLGIGFGRGMLGWNPPIDESRAQWVHARVGGCGGRPRVSNLDRVTCPECIAGEVKSDKTVIEEG